MRQKYKTVAIAINWPSLIEITKKPHNIVLLRPGVLVALFPVRPVQHTTVYLHTYESRT